MTPVYIRHGTRHIGEGVHDCRPRMKTMHWIWVSFHKSINEHLLKETVTWWFALRIIYMRMIMLSRIHNSVYWTTSPSVYTYRKSYSLNKKEWICSLFKEWILEKSEIRVNLESTFVLFTHFGMTKGITQGFRVIPEVTPKWVNNTNVHSKFTLISLFFKFTP